MRSLLSTSRNKDYATEIENYTHDFEHPGDKELLKNPTDHKVAAHPDSEASQNDNDNPEDKVSDHKKTHHGQY